MGACELEIMKREYPYDHQTKRVIRERVALMDSQKIVQREYNLMLRKEMLIGQWVTAASEGKQALRDHLKDCISIVNYELDLLHKAMKTKKLKSLSDEPDREVLIQKIKNMTNSSEQQNQ